MFYDTFISAVKECHACRGTAAGTDGAAVSRQIADRLFNADRNKIGENQCADQLFMSGIQFFCIFHNGHGDGKALIAAPGIDDCRQLTAAHARIGTGGRGSHCAEFYVRSLFSEQEKPSDFRSPASFHAFLRQCRVT